MRSQAHSATSCISTTAASRNLAEVELHYQASTVKLFLRGALGCLGVCWRGYRPRRNQDGFLCDGASRPAITSGAYIIATLFLFCTRRSNCCRLMLTAIPNGVLRT